MKHNLSTDKLLYENNYLNNIFSQFSNNICNKHNKEYNFFCKTCSVDLCIFCKNAHINHHSIIDYEIIYPQKDEIKLLIDSIKKYNDDYNKLLSEIFSWRKEIDKIIIFYQNKLKNNKRLNDNINFIFNIRYYKMNYNLILKFREIYSNVIEPQKRQHNNQILNYMTKECGYNEAFTNENKMGLFNYNKYSMMIFCLDKIREINKEYDFVNNSNYIIKILWDAYKDNNDNNNNTFYIGENKTMYKKDNIYSLSDGNLLNRNKNFFFNEKNELNIINNSYYDIGHEKSNVKSKHNIIEKYIDLTKKNKRINIGLNTEESINLTKNKSLYTSKIGNIFLEQNNLNLKLSSNAISNNNNCILYKKYISKTPLVKHNLVPININICSKIDDKKIYHKKKSNSKNKWNKKRSNSFNLNNKDNNDLNINDIELNLNNKNIKSNNNKIIIDKYVPKIKVHNRIYVNKDKLGKTYIHKKFDATNTVQISDLDKNKELLYSPKISSSLSNRHEKMNTYNENNDNSYLDEESRLNITFTQSENVQKKLNFDCFDNNKNNNNNNLNYNLSNINNLTPMNNKVFNKSKFNINKNNIYSNNTYDPSYFNLKDNYNFKLLKNSIKNKYIIDQNKPLCIGLEFSSNNCKICIMNQNEQNNTIDLFCFKENAFSIPTILAFNDKSDEIEIGFDAYDCLMINPQKTIFNIMKLFGKKYNDISQKNYLYPYNIYSNENTSSRPYIKINYNNHKEKHYYFEDLFTIYMIKLFEIIFTEIEIENKEKDKNNKNIIQLSLVVGISNNLSYFQRKIIEKIFQTQVFPEYIFEIGSNINDNKLDNISITSSKLSTSQSANSIQSKRKKKIYGGYQIILKDIMIENSSSISCLCLKLNNDNKKRILSININGDSINLSLSSIFQKKNDKNEVQTIYEMKAENCIQKGEEDFIDNYIEQKLKNNNNKISEENYINVLRKKCYEIIANINDNNINNELVSYENYEKNEFINSLNNIYNKIILSIKKMFKKEKTNENNITNILLIGSMTKTNIFIQMLKKLFKYNNQIITKLSLIEKRDNSSEIYDDFFVVCGAGILSKNLNNINTKCILNDICPMSFGIESLDGLMEFVVEKGTKIPTINQKFIKIKKENENDKNENYLEINVYEGENKEANKNNHISCVNIDKRNFKNEKICNNYIELLIQFEIDKNFNLRVFVLEPINLKRRFECLVNIDIIRG